MTNWVVAADALVPERAHRLMAPTSFDEILHRLRGRRAPPPAWETAHKSNQSLQGARRAVWAITPVDKHAPDLFFNGRNGYRAAYLASEKCGEELNANALAFLSSWLRDFQGKPVIDASPHLLGAGAKLWIPEDKRIHHALLTGQTSPPEILVQSWSRAAEDGLKVPTWRGDRYKAAAGILAPNPTMVKVIGAWIRDGCVLNALIKNRSAEIHRYGYT